MMDLESAIRHCEEVMVENLEKTKDRNASDPKAINCFECAEEHRQLAEWLKELKRLREQESKTGRWIATDEGFSLYECSICGSVEFCESSYCPRCGAKMEAEDDGK